MSEDPPAGIDEFEDDASVMHSFIIRLWKEEDGTATRREVWRGHMTSIPGNQRYYFTSVEEIPSLIASHLDDPG